MGYLKNHEDKKGHRDNRRSKNAYKPKRPFRSVEGIESPAWRKLSPYAVWVLMEFYIKFDGYNRSCLSLTYNEVNGKIASGTFTKSIWELIAFGFIEVVRWGRLERNNSIYMLSNRWMQLSKDSKKLDKIEKLLSHAEKVKRINTPKHLEEEQKREFGIKRRKILRKIRNKITGYKPG